MYTVAFYFTGDELSLLQVLYLIDPYRLTEEYENTYRIMQIMDPPGSDIYVTKVQSKEKKKKKKKKKKERKKERKKRKEKKG